MVADIGHRYISEGAKGSALEHKKIGRALQQTVTTPAPRRATVPPSLNLAPFRFMEHSVHSIFSIVDRPYLSYLCFF